MAKIIHLVRVTLDKYGHIEPLDEKDCPLYKKHLIKTWCRDNDKFCKGIIGDNLYKVVKGKDYDLLQCDWCLAN